MRSAVLLLAILIAPCQTFAGGPCSGVKGGCGRGTSYRSSPPSGPVHVSGYTKQDGTYVEPHTRTRPDGDPTNNLSSKKTSSISVSHVPDIPLPSARTKARTEARTSVWHGTQSAPDDERERKLRFVPPPVERAENEMRTWRSGTHTIEARFVSLSSGMVKLHTADGRDITIALEKLSPEDQAWIDRRR